MTVRELIELLGKEDQDAEIYLATNCHGCFAPIATVRKDERGMVVVEDQED